MPDVRRARRGDLELSLAAGPFEASGQAHRIVVQQLARAGLDQERRQPLERAVHGRRERITKMCTAQEAIDEEFELLGQQEGVPLRVAAAPCAGPFHVGPRRDRDPAGRQGDATVARHLHDAEGQAAAGQSPRRRRHDSPPRHRPGPAPAMP